MSDTRQIEDPTLQRVTAQGDYLWKTCDYVVENLRWLQKTRVAGLDEFRERAQETDLRRRQKQIEDSAVSGGLRATPDTQRTFVLVHYIFHQRHPHTITA